MNSLSSFFTTLPGSAATLLVVMLLASSSPTANAAEQRPLIDDFSDSTLQTSGMPRMVIDDNQAGGQSQATTTFSEGVMTIEGKLVPGRGSPGFISIPLILSANSEPSDLSHFTGVRMRVKLVHGSLVIQASSTDVTNFDYHSSPPITRAPDTFQVVEIPFVSMKRIWSAQTPLNLKSITSINLVSAGMAPDSIAYQIDEISFY